MECYTPEISKVVIPVEFPTGIVTMAFTDVESSSDLSERYRAAFEPLRQAHYTLLRDAATRWNGCEVSTAGDSIFLVFQSAADGVRWAAEVQKEMLAQTWAVKTPAGEEEIDLRVRIGLHTGEPYTTITPEETNYYGPSVNRAARVMSAGNGGQVLITGATRELVLPTLPDTFGYRDMGTHRLKGVGEERLYQLLHPDLLTDFRPLATLNPERHNLPLSMTPYIGRETEIEEWLELLLRPSTRLLTITGFGGLGKTRSAQQLAELSVDHFPDGVWWVEAEEANTGEEMARRIADALLITLQPSTPIKEQLGQAVRGKKVLLVLDNMEQVKDPATFIKDMLAATPDLKFLVTSRRTLKLRGETVVEINPLPAGDAARLFIDRARAIKDDFEVTEQNREDIDALCSGLEGIPLAIELAAARIVGMAPRQILERLNERFRLLQTRAPDLPPRQRALRAAIDWSYTLLTDDDKALFAQLSVFAGGFTMDDAEKVCNAFDVFEGVMELRHHSFFRDETDEKNQETRFTMLEAVREYASEKLGEEDDSGKAVHKRHAEYFVKFAKARLEKIRTPDELKALRQLEANSKNIRSAMQWAGEIGLSPLQSELALVLGKTLQRQGFCRSAAEVIEVGLAVSEPLKETHPEIYSHLLLERVGLHLDYSEWDVARSKAMEVLALFTVAGDKRGLAHAENLLGQAAMFCENYKEAREHFQNELAHYGSAADSIDSAIVYNNLGILERRDETGNKQEAERHFKESLRIRRAQNDRRGIAETLNNLGVLSQDQNDMETAARHYTEALQFELELRHTLGVATVLYNLGEVVEAQGFLLRACTLFARAERIMEEINSPLKQFVSDRLEKAAATVPLSYDELNGLRKSAKNLTVSQLVTQAVSPD
jgi:predicted ATPase/class 3 adenylate cyclase